MRNWRPVFLCGVLLLCVGTMTGCCGFGWFCGGKEAAIATRGKIAELNRLRNNEVKIREEDLESFLKDVPDSKRPDPSNSDQEIWQYRFVEFVPLFNFLFREIAETEHTLTIYYDRTAHWVVSFNFNRMPEPDEDEKSGEE